MPVTVIEADPNRITSLSTVEQHGYRAVQVSYGSKRRNLIDKPLAGILAKAGVESAEGLHEFRLDGKEAGELSTGSENNGGYFSRSDR